MAVPANEFARHSVSRGRSDSVWSFSRGTIAAPLALAGVLTYIMLGTVCIAAQGETAEELLMQAAAHTGDKQITTGEFRYKLSATKSPPTKEEIRRRTEETRQILQEQLDKVVDNEDLRRRYQEAIDTADEYVPPQLIRNAARTSSYYFVLGGPKLGSDRYVEFSNLDRATGLPGPSSVLLERFLGVSGGISLFLEGGVGQAVASREAAFPGSQEPQRLGRLTGYLGDLAASAGVAKGLTLQDVVASAAVSRASGEGGSEVREVYCRIAASTLGIHGVKFQIDPTRGYITPLVEEQDAAGNVLRQWASSDYFQVAGTTLWFPKVCAYREALTESSPRTERYEFSPKNVRLNVAIPAERFAIVLDPGGVLIDARDGDGSDANFRAAREIKVSLDDLDHIDQVAGLNRVAVVAAAKPPVSPLSIWLIAGNVVVVCILLAWVIRRRRRHLAAAFAVALVAALPSGCDQPLEQFTPTADLPMVVAPRQIELGEVAADGRAVMTTLRVENRARHGMQVKIFPSCGCTALDSDYFSLAPGESRDVELAVHARGRKGDSRALLRIVASHADQLIQETLVPVNARFRDDWHAQPNRVYLAADPNGGATGMCSVSGPSENWKDIDFKVEESGIEVDLSSTETEGHLETRNFRISASGVNDGNYALAFRRPGQEQPFLVIPVLVRTNSNRGPVLVP